MSPSIMSTSTSTQRSPASTNAHFSTNITEVLRRELKMGYRLVVNRTPLKNSERRPRPSIFDIGSTRKKSAAVPPLFPARPPKLQQGLHHLHRLDPIQHILAIDPACPRPSLRPPRRRLPISPKSLVQMASSCPRRRNAARDSTYALYAHPRITWPMPAHPDVSAHKPAPLPLRVPSPQPKLSLWSTQTRCDDC